MDRLQNSFISIEQVKDTYFNRGKENINQNGGKEADFKQILESAREKSSYDLKVTFSKHANERLESRNINLSEEQMTRLNKGIMQAKEKD